MLVFEDRDVDLMWFEEERIIEHKTKYRKSLYLVKWKNLSYQKATWENSITNQAVLLKYQESCTHSNPITIPSSYKRPHSFQPISDFPKSKVGDIFERVSNQWNKLASQTLVSQAK